MADYNSSHTGQEVDASVDITENLAPVSEILSGGWANYQDLATQTVLFNYTGGSGQVKIPNDGLGAFTTEHKLPTSISRLYNKTTQQLDFSDLKVDDEFTFRFDLEVTTSVNSQEVDMYMVFGIGSASEFAVAVDRSSKKLSGSLPVFRQASFAIFSADIRDNPAELRIKSADNCTVKVNGFYIPVTSIGV